MKIRRRKIASALTNWPKLVEEVMDLNERELEELLRQERSRAPAPRRQFLERAHQRLSKLRAQREREELLKGVDGDDNIH